MDTTCARQINELTKAFYRVNASSFADTRTQSWRGWETLFEKIMPTLTSSVSVLDVGCGNMRFLSAFRAYLNRVSPERSWTIDYHGIDCTDELVRTADGVSVQPLARTSCTYQHLDIIEELISCDEPTSFAAKIEAPACDLVVAFGFMHHIPTPALRKTFLAALATRVRQGGYLALSFWRPLADERIEHKAHAATERAREQTHIEVDLATGDAFLNWQDNLESFRFCHHFSEQEIDELSCVLTETGFDEVDRFFADGKTGCLNRYAIWQKRS